LNQQDKESTLAHPLVVHCKRAPYDVYIGRGGKWGSPLKIGVHGTREQVIDLYEQWLLNQPHLMAAISELTGNTLGCWCAPHACHGEVLTRLAAPWAKRPLPAGERTAAMTLF
jgi:uncharacterized protein DUF4326